MTSIFQTWLPSQLADAPAQDRQQLTALSSALATAWSSDASLVDRLAETVRWLPLVKTCAAGSLYVCSRICVSRCQTPFVQHA